ncbi:MAG: MauE/DoxX family redox-associated membrane protein [Pseudonocardiaceae bacterium]
MTYLVFGARCLLVVVFACSAWGKLRGAGSFAAFRRATAELVPPARAHAGPLAAAVIGTELTVVMLLGIPAITWVGLGASVALLLAFTVALVTALRRGSTAPCRCFGGGGASPLGVRHLVRNAGLLLVAVAGLVAAVAETSDVVSAEIQPLGLVMAAVVAVVLAALVLCFDALTDLFAGTPSRSAVPAHRYLERITT